MKYIYIKTFGCQSNEYDSSCILDLFNLVYGLKIVNNPSLSDIFLINTCSIRFKSEHKIYSEIGKFKFLKNFNPNIIIGVIGCTAVQIGMNIYKYNSFVDLVCSSQIIHKIPRMIENIIKCRSLSLKKKFFSDFSFPLGEKFKSFSEKKAKNISEYLSIMEGCNKYCSYCVVPYLRGNEVSRPFEDIVFDAVNFANQGVKEIILLGQNVNSYLSKVKNDKFADLSLLIKYISSIDSIKRIRFLTSNPVDFTDNLINLYSENNKVVNHLHLPIQSGSDLILNRMKRGYNVYDYKKIVFNLKFINPFIQISTDIIVGFPGETDEDFCRTLDIVKEIQFDHPYSFIYSPRIGTPAFNFVDNIKLNIKKYRLRKLQKVIEEQNNIIIDNMINTIHNVLVFGRKDNNFVFGYTENNKLVQFYGPHVVPGNVVNLRLEKFFNGKFLGVLI